MKANIEKAKQSAFDLLNSINELKTLIPELLEKYNELEQRITILEQITDGQSNN